MPISLPRALTALAVVATALGSTNTAHAQSSSDEPPEAASTPAEGAIARPVRIDADVMLAGTHADDDYPRHTLMSLVLTGTYRAEHAELELSLPAAYDAYSFLDSSRFADQSDAHAAFGNPVVGGFYARALRFGRLRVGGSIALPVASSATASAAALSGAAYARTYDHVWHWRPGQLGVLPSVRLESLESQGFQYATELVVGASIRVRDRDDYVDGGYVVLNLSQDLAYRRGALRLGGRAVVATTRNDVHLSVMPYVGGDFDIAYFDIGLNVDLDNPFGATADDGLWAVRLRGGARF